MRHIYLVFAALLLVANTSCAASFDCEKATTKVEKMICADSELSKLDEDLSAAYSKVLKESSDASTLKQQQRDWLKERNGCEDSACVKHAYEARVSLLTGTQTVASNDAITRQAEGNNSQSSQQYYFQLTKGAGTPVCDAYLERLNTTKYEKPPYCDRPENDAVQGFAKLSRAPLSSKDVHDLSPIIFTFMGMANRKEMNWTDIKTQERLMQARHINLSKSGIDGLQRDMDAGWAKIWGYDPSVDVDNDDLPDNVEIWHGTPVRGVGGTVCGGQMLRFPNDLPLRQPQIAFVVTESGNRLDVSKTEKIFAHPNGGYRVYSGHEKKWIVSSDFRPVGRSIGIFKYRDLYYFDTFFNTWGDFEDKRRLEGTQNKNKDIVNTLAVFLHKSGKTQQVCEYLMTDNNDQ